MLIPAILIGLASVLIITRFFSGQAATSTKLFDGDRTIPAVPHWIPYLGHFPQLLLYPGKFLRYLNVACARGLCYLSLGGHYHAYVFAPAFAAHLLSQPPNIADPRPVTRYYLWSVFGFPQKELELYDAATPALLECDAQSIDPETTGRDNLTEAVVRQLKATAHDFVSFCQSPVDQTAWERISKVGDISTDPSGDRVAEADLILLVKNFVANVLLTSLLGPDFVRINPTFAQDLWAFDDALSHLSSGLPRWIPYPPLTRAHINQRRILHALSTFEAAGNRRANEQDPGPDYSDLDQVSNYMQSRQAIYRRHGLSPDAAASLDLSVVWSLVTNTANLVSWLVLHIYADHPALASIRQELTQSMALSTPSQGFGVMEPTRLLTVDVGTLRQEDTIIKSIYDHVLRTYTTAWESRQLQRDLILSSTRTTASHWKAPPKNEYAETYLIKKGIFVHVPRGSQILLDDKRASDHDLQMQLPPRVHSFGVYQPSMPNFDLEDGCTALVNLYVLLCTAAIITMWDVKPASGMIGRHGLELPKSRDRLFGIATPGHIDYRALITRRKDV